ncbi:1746_t:CDS:2, partial [Dentiscutata heterogama]
WDEMEEEINTYLEQARLSKALLLQLTQEFGQELTKPAQGLKFEEEYEIIDAGNCATYSNQSWYKSNYTDLFLEFLDIDLDSEE